MMFARERQKLAEKMGLRSASTYDKEFEAGCILLENTGVGSEKLVCAARDHAALYWIPNLKLGKPAYPTQTAAESSSSLASALSAFPYAHTLLKVAQALRAATLEQQNYARDVDLHYAAPLKEWLATREGAYRVARKDMEKKRLAMDAAAWAARSVPNPNDPKKIKAESTLREHNDAMLKVQGFVKPIKEDHLKHRALLGELLSLQRKLYNTCDAEVERAIKELGLMSTAFDFAKQAANPHEPPPFPIKGLPAK